MRVQIAPDSWFLTMADEAFASAFGTEWFIRTGQTRGRRRAVRHHPLGRGVILDLHDLWSWVVVIGNGLAGRGASGRTGCRR